MRGFIEDDNDLKLCMAEVREFQMLAQLYNLFVTLLLFENITDKNNLWEENYIIIPEELAKIYMLITIQRAIFEEIIMQKIVDVYFLDGFAGSSKTYLYNCLLAHVQKCGLIVLTVAFSEIAAILLKGSRTAHLRFKIPIAIDENIMCNIKNQIDLAKLL